MNPNNVYLVAGVVECLFVVAGVINLVVGNPHQAATFLTGPRLSRELDDW